MILSKLDTFLRPLVPWHPKPGRKSCWPSSVAEPCIVQVVGDRIRSPKLTVFSSEIIAFSTTDHMILRFLCIYMI